MLAAGLRSAGLSHASHAMVLLSADLASEDSAEWEQYFKKKMG